MNEYHSKVDLVWFHVCLDCWYKTAPSWSVCMKTT